MRAKAENNSLQSVTKHKKAINSFNLWVNEQKPIIWHAINGGVLSPMIDFFELKTPFSVEIARGNDSDDKDRLIDGFYVEIYNDKGALVYVDQLTYETRPKANLAAIKKLFQLYNEYLNDK